MIFVPISVPMPIVSCHFVKHRNLPKSGLRCTRTQLYALGVLLEGLRTRAFLLCATLGHFAPPPWGRPVPAVASAAALTLTATAATFAAAAATELEPLRHINAGLCLQVQLLLDTRLRGRWEV